LKTNRVYPGKEGLIGELRKRELLAKQAKAMVENDIVHSEDKIIRSSHRFAKNTLVSAGFVVANTVINGLSAVTDINFFDSLARINDLANVNIEAINKVREFCPVTALGTLAVTAGMFATFSALRTNDLNKRINQDNKDLSTLAGYSKLCKKARHFVSEGYISANTENINNALGIASANPVFEEDGGISQLDTTKPNVETAEKIITSHVPSDIFKKIDEKENKRCAESIEKHKDKFEKSFEDTSGSLNSSDIKIIAGSVGSDDNLSPIEPQQSK